MMTRRAIVMNNSSICISLILELVMSFAYSCLIVLFKVRLVEFEIFINKLTFVE